jgi:hypothetical protein
MDQSKCPVFAGAFYVHETGLLGRTKDFTGD